MLGEEDSDNSLAKGFATLQVSQRRKERIICEDQLPLFDPPEGTRIAEDPETGRKDFFSCALFKHPRGSWYDAASGCIRERVNDYLWKPIPCSVHRNAMHAHLESHHQIQESSAQSSAPKATKSGTTAQTPLEPYARPGQQRRKLDVATDICRPENPRPSSNEPSVKVWKEHQQWPLSNCETVGWDKHTLSHPHHPGEAPVNWQLEGQDLVEDWCTIHGKKETFKRSYYGRDMLSVRIVEENDRRSMEPLECGQDEEGRDHCITITPVTQNPGEFRLTSAISPPLPQEPVFLQTCDGDGPPPDFPWFDPDRPPVGWIPASSRKLGFSWCEKHGKDETGTKRDYLPVPFDRTTQRSYRSYIDDPNEVRKQPLFSDAPTRVSEGGSASAVTTTQLPSNA